MATPSGDHPLSRTIPDIGQGANSLERTRVDEPGSAVDIDPAFLRPDGRGLTIADRSSTDSAVPLPSTAPDIPDHELVHEPSSTAGNRYDMGSLLGSGATSHVYAAHDRNFDRAVAVKFLDAGLAGDGHRMARFIREARITARLEHPNIVPVYDLDSTPRGDLYLTMRQVSGMSLGDALRRREAGEDVPAISDWNRIVTVFLKLCDALASAHDRGIVHRDLKPDNVMLGKFGEVVLVDWGAARALNDLDPAGPRRIVGTPAYMSPEQARGEMADFCSDVYCLGTTLFQTLTGRLPTWGKDDADFWQRKRAGDIDPLTRREKARIPARLLAIACKAISSDRAGRYQTVSAIAADLHAYQAGLSVSAYRESWIERALRWQRRHWRSLAIGTAMLVILLGSAAFVVGERLKEMVRWGSPVLTEDFSAGWEDRWLRLARSEWTVREGRLRNLSQNASFIFLRKPLRGAVAVEFVGEMTSDGPPGDLSVIWSPTEPDPTSIVPPVGSWWMQVGAYDNTRILISGGSGRLTMGEDAYRLEPGRAYHLRYEIDGDRLSILIDHRLVMTVRTPQPCTSGWIGLYSYYPGKAFASLTVRNKTLPERLPSIAIGDALVERGHLEDAIDAYREVAEAHAGTAMADLAQLRRGLVEASLGRWDDACRSWAGLRDPELRGLADVAAIEHVLADGNLEEAADRFRLLIEHRSPAVKARLPSIAAKAFEAAMNQHDGRLAAERWLAITDSSFRGNALVEFWAATWLQVDNRCEEVLRRFPAQRRACATVLVEMGRYRDVVDEYQDEPFARPLALFQLGRFNEVYDQYGRNSSFRHWVLRSTGRYQESEAFSLKEGYAPTETLIAEGRYEEALALGLESSPFHRMFALHALGRDAEIGSVLDADGRHPGTPVVVLLRQGRYDEARAACRVFEHELIACVHFCRLYDALDRGDQAAADAARQALDGIVMRPAWLKTWLDQRVLRPLADHGAAGLRDALRACVAEGKDGYLQRLWHIAACATGEIDETTFLAQPCRMTAIAALPLVQAFKAELADDPHQAAACYGRYLDQPLHVRRWDIIEGLATVDRFAAWRLRVLGKAP